MKKLNFMTEFAILTLLCDRCFIAFAFHLAESQLIFIDVQEFLQKTRSKQTKIDHPDSDQTALTDQKVLVTQTHAGFQFEAQMSHFLIMHSKFKKFAFLKTQT